MIWFKQKNIPVKYVEKGRSIIWKYNRNDDFYFMAPEEGGYLHWQVEAILITSLYYIFF